MTDDGYVCILSLYKTKDVSLSTLCPYWETEIQNVQILLSFLQENGWDSRRSKQGHGCDAGNPNYMQGGEVNVSHYSAELNFIFDFLTAQGYTPQLF